MASIPSLQRLASVLVLALSLFACGDDPGVVTEPTEGARLVPLSDLTQVLRYGDSVDLSVRYEQSDGALVSGATLVWELDGFAPEAGLSAMRTSTDGGGISENGLNAGGIDATFTVTVTPPVGEPLVFMIAVTDEDSGSIRVNLAYTGAAPAPFDSYETYLFQDMSCDSFDPASLPPAMIAAAPVDSLTSSPGFVPVTVGSGYAVAVQAKESGTVTGFGCAEGISVANAEETTVGITIDDLEIQLLVQGAYLLDNRFDFGEGLPTSVRSGIDVIAELFDDEDVTGATPGEYGQDPGAFITDFAMRQTCHWECLAGEDYDDCSEINHPLGDLSALYLEDFMSWDGGQSRFFGGCGGWESANEPVQNLINDQIDMFVPDSITAWGVIASDLAGAINNARISSRLTVDQGSGGSATFIHELLEMTVVVHDLDGVEHEETFDVLMAGLGGRPRSEGTMIMVDGTRLEVPMHGFDLDYGKLVRYIYVNIILPEIGYMSSAEMLRDWVDCGAVGVTLADRIGGLSATTYEGYCDTALGSAGTFLDFGIEGAIGAEGVLTLQGTATAGDPMPDGTATTLNEGIWMGGWSEGGGDSGQVDGNFTGVRQ